MSIWLSDLCCCLYVVTNFLENGKRQLKEILMVYVKVEFNLGPSIQVVNQGDIWPS